MKNITLQEYINRELDRTYAKSAGKLLADIKKLAMSPGSQIQRSLVEMRTEADRLEENNEVLQSDNAYLQKVLFAISVFAVRVASLILAHDNDIQSAGFEVAIRGVTAKVFRNTTSALISAGIDPMSQEAFEVYKKVLDARNIPWNMTPDAVSKAEDFVSSIAWSQKMMKWGDGYANLIKERILEGIQKGWGPRYTASKLQEATLIPLYAAESLTRTLQITAYREASVAMEAVNGQFIEYKIRVAVLDNKTCLSCIDLHGTKMRPGERVDDHYNGRCSELYKVPGVSLPKIMKADGKMIPFTNGRDWFASLPEKRQKLQRSFANSPAKYKAYKDGAPLSIFVGDHTDPVFGHQFIEKSLKDAIGEENALSYYTRGKTAE